MEILIFRPNCMNIITTSNRIEVLMDYNCNKYRVILKILFYFLLERAIMAILLNNCWRKGGGGIFMMINVKSNQISYGLNSNKKVTMKTNKN